MAKTIKKEVEFEEWEARKRIAPTGMGGGEMGVVRCCPLCGGVEPTDMGYRNFIEEAIGHRDDCEFKERGL